MKSPFTGNEAYLDIEARTLTYRKEPFDVLYNFFVCEDTKEQLRELLIKAARELLNQVNENITSDVLDVLIDAKVINIKLTQLDFEFLQKYGIFKLIQI